MSTNITFIRYLTGAAVAIVLIVLLAVIGLAVARGTPVSSNQLLGLLGVVGTLVALLANLLGTNATASAVHNVSQGQGLLIQKMNGHLEQHLGHTDDGVKQLVDQRLQEQGLTPPPPQGESV